MDLAALSSLQKNLSSLSFLISYKSQIACRIILSPVNVRVLLSPVNLVDSPKYSGYILVTSKSWQFGFEEK